MFPFDKMKSAVVEITRGAAEFFSRVVPLLDGRQKRPMRGAAAELGGRGGRIAVADAAGVVAAALAETDPLGVAGGRARANLRRGGLRCDHGDSARNGIGVGWPVRSDVAEVLVQCTDMAAVQDARSRLHSESRCA